MQNRTKTFSGEHFCLKVSNGTQKTCCEHLYPDVQNVTLVISCNGESDKNSYIRKEEIYFTVKHTHTCVHAGERERGDRQREGKRWGRQKDGMRQKDVLMKHNWCVMYYDHSVWPANKDEA